MNFFKACEKTFTIVELNVKEVNEEYLLVENKRSYNEIMKIPRVGNNYNCFTTFEEALRYLLSLSNSKLNKVRKDLKEAIENHSKLELMIDKDKIEILQIG